MNIELKDNKTLSTKQTWHTGRFQHFSVVVIESNGHTVHPLHYHLTKEQITTLEAILFNAAYEMLTEEAIE